MLARSMMERGGIEIRRCECWSEGEPMKDAMKAEQRMKSMRIARLIQGKEGPASDEGQVGSRSL